jgi:beta-glucosidase
MASSPARIASRLALVLALCAGTAHAEAPTPRPAAMAVHPDLWPQARSPIGLDPALEAKIGTIIAKMTLEEKVGQVLQPEIRWITPDEVRDYHIGSIENGGGPSRRATSMPR